MSDTSLIFSIIGRDSGLNRVLSGVRESLRATGTEGEAAFRRAGSGTDRLDRQIMETKARLASLNREFAQTGDKTLFFKIRQDRGLLTQLERVRKDLRQTGDEADTVEQAGGALSGVFSSLIGSTGGFGSAMSSLGSSLGAAGSNVYSLVGATMLVSAAMAVAAPAAYALGGALASLPALASGAAAALAVLGLGAFGLSENWTAMTKAAGGGGGGGAAKAAQDLTPKLRAVEAAQRDVTRSARDVIDAQNDARDAVIALTKARASEQERIEDLGRSLRGAKLDEQDATMGVAEAEQALAVARAGQSNYAITQATLALEKQKLALEDAKDKTGDLQKESDEAAVKGVEGSDAVVQAKKQEVAAQRRVQDATDQHTLAVQRLGDAQADLKRKTDAAGAAAGGLAKQIPKISTNAMAFLNVLKGLKPAFDRLRLDVQQRLFDGLAGKLQILADRWIPQLRISLGDMADTFNGVFKKMFDSLSDPTFIKNIATGVDSVNGALGKIGRAVAGPLVDAWGRLSAAATPFVTMLGDKLAGIITKFSEWIAKADDSGALTLFFEKAAQITGSLFDILTDVARIAGDVIGILFGTNAGSTDAWDNLAAAVHKVADFMGDPKVQAKISSFLDFFGGAAFMIGDFLAALDTIGTGIQNALAWIADFPKKAGNFLGRLPGVVSHWLSAAISKLGYWIGYGIGWAIKQFLNLPNTIGRALAALPRVFAAIGTWLWNAVKNLPGQMWTIGKNIVTGIWNGIVSLSNWLWQRASDFAAGIWRGIKDALGISSPSKVMAEQVGKWIPLGIAQGIDQHAGAVKDAAGRIASVLAGTEMALPGIGMNSANPQLAGINGARAIALSRRDTPAVHIEVTGDAAGMVKVIRKLDRTRNLAQSGTR